MPWEHDILALVAKHLATLEKFWLARETMGFGQVDVRMM